MSLSVVPDPKGMQWQDWSDTVAGFNPGLVGRLPVESDWRAFADGLTLFEPAAPRHDIFDTWDAWARALKFALSV